MALFDRLHVYEYITFVISTQFMFLYRIVSDILFSGILSLVTGSLNGPVLFWSLASVVVCRGLQHSTAGLQAASAARAGDDVMPPPV